MHCWSLGSLPVQSLQNRIPCLGRAWVDGNIATVLLHKIPVRVCFYKFHRTLNELHKVSSVPENVLISKYRRNYLVAVIE